MRSESENAREQASKPNGNDHVMYDHDKGHHESVCISICGKMRT